MSFELVLNELSFHYPAPSIAEARQRMSRFIKTFITATGEYKLERILRMQDESINSLELAPGYPLARWRNDTEVGREERGFLRRLTAKHPYLVEHAKAEDAALTMECYWNNTQAIGLRAALLLDTLAISLLSDPVWDTSRVEVMIQELDSEGEWSEYTEQVYHISTIHHLRELAPWITQRQQAERKQQYQDIQTGAALWEQRNTLFPLLEFCPVVQEQLHVHAPQHNDLKAISQRLLYLEQYSQQWQESGGNFDTQHLPGNVSPESPATLQHGVYGPQRIFQCPDGEYRTFSWHMKKGRWRVHFYPDESRQVIIIGYIGPHLKTVKYRN